MARYCLVHPYEKLWLGLKEDGTYDWVPYEQKTVFKNGIEAKAALDTIEIIRDSYNSVVKPHWMNVTGLL